MYDVKNTPSQIRAILGESFRNQNKEKSSSNFINFQLKKMLIEFLKILKNQGDKKFPVLQGFQKYPVC